jgi:hypothetical protein
LRLCHKTGQFIQIAYDSSFLRDLLMLMIEREEAGNALGAGLVITGFFSFA